jgi:hypothetical protein
MEMQMKQLIVAASAVALLAASSLTAVAAEATGTIVSIDAAAGTVTLDDGKVFRMPAAVSPASLMPGQKVKITFQEQVGGLLAASAIEPAAGGPVTTYPPTPLSGGGANTGVTDRGLAGPGAPRGD